MAKAQGKTVCQYGPQLSFRPHLWDQKMSDQDREKVKEIEDAEKAIQVQEEFVDDLKSQLKAAKEELADRINHLRVLSRPDGQQRLIFDGDGEDE